MSQNMKFMCTKHHKWASFSCPLLQQGSGSAHAPGKQPSAKQRDRQRREQPWRQRAAN